MSEPAAWQPERYRSLLQVQARQLQLDPRLRRRFDSSDLVQEALLKAHQGLAGFRGRTEGELVKWLQQILANVARDRAREEKAQKRDVTREQSINAAVTESSLHWEAVLADRHGSPEEEAARRELLLRLTGAIDCLPDDQRDVVIYRDLMGMAMAEIAAQMDRSEKAVAGLLLRGRRRLRELLADYQ
jgi:RNA polymerase sigma-70 factor (ECF subfamily)